MTLKSLKNGEKTIFYSWYKSTNNPVVKVKGRRPETLTTGLFVLSMPGMAT